MSRYGGGFGEENLQEKIDLVRKKIANKREVEKDIIRKYAHDNKVTEHVAEQRLVETGQLKNLFLKAKIGNCSECANGFATTLYKEYDEVKSIDSIGNRKPYDHNFLVLNRKASTDLKVPQSWNKDAIVVDPWIGEVFTFEEFNKFGPEKPIQDSNIYNPKLPDGTDQNTYILRYRIEK